MYIPLLCIVFSFLYFTFSLFRPFVDGFLAFYHFGICCVYVVFISESIKQIVDEYLVVLDIRIHMCFVLVPLFLIYSIRSLRFLAIFSSAANVLLFAGKFLQNPICCSVIINAYAAKTNTIKMSF